MNNHPQKPHYNGTNNNKCINPNITHKTNAKTKRTQSVSNDAFINQPGDSNFQIIPSTSKRNLTSTFNDPPMENNNNKNNTSIYAS